MMAVLGLGLVLFYPGGGPDSATENLGSVEFEPFAYLETEDSLNSFGENIQAEGMDLSSDDSLAQQESAIPEDEGEKEITEDGITIVFGSRNSNTRRSPGMDANNQSEIEPKVTTLPLDSASGQTTSQQTNRTAAAVQEKPVAQAARNTVEPRAKQEYWVQVFAGSSRSNAEFARQKFVQEAAMQPMVTTASQAEGVVYRLRVGPYAQRSEAEALVARLNEGTSFSGSYISVVYN